MSACLTTSITHAGECICSGSCFCWRLRSGVTGLHIVFWRGLLYVQPVCMALVGGMPAEQQTMMVMV
jgi:hypothetical protein